MPWGASGHYLLWGELQVIQASEQVKIGTQTVEFFSRLESLRRRRGIFGGLEHAAVRVRRALFENWRILFYCDLQGQALSGASYLPKHLSVERKSQSSEIGEKDWQAVFKIWDPRLSRRTFAQRFARGANMWLLRSQEEVAAYGWTLTGGMIQPHYCYQLGEMDVHLFDFTVLPEFRQQGINSVLVNHILQELGAEGKARAYIESYEWNRPMLRSLARTRFRPFAKAYVRFFLGRTIIEWRNPPHIMGAVHHS